MGKSFIQFLSYILLSENGRRECIVSGYSIMVIQSTFCLQANADENCLSFNKSIKETEVNDEIETSRTIKNLMTLITAKTFQ